MLFLQKYKFLIKTAKQKSAICEKMNHILTQIYRSLTLPRTVDARPSNNIYPCLT